ncbi:hypothetical protein E2C01_054947 [Portunus trituberculatus]|uniref:Uncharacterized protein n=1 Tax=Portunus trituberculatus TaxID=210409 RepID=A0A5B7GUM1_PORTR|nr:hypothetical protein [Portunus trituberculatus]
MCALHRRRKLEEAGRRHSWSLAPPRLLATPAPPRPSLSSHKTFATNSVTRPANFPPRGHNNQSVSL